MCQKNPHGDASNFQLLIVSNIVEEVPHHAGRYNANITQSIGVGSQDE